MSARRQQLVDAFQREDHDAIKAAGWWPVWEVCTTAWAPRQTATARDMIPYAKRLGDYEPDQIIAAFDACAGPWRPVPGELLGWLNRTERGSDRADLGRATDPANTPDAIQAVADAIQAGDHACTCGCPTARTWRLTTVGVLRCPTCQHIEQGQVFAAEDAGLLQVAA